jgi:tetratricopeptide (TPR) repeat protein
VGWLLPVCLGIFACTDPEPPPSVLLITLDTTRADRLGSYGYLHAETPTSDRLAAQGVRYSRAYSTCPLTIPSHATIFTGRTPMSHGVRDNGDFVLGDAAVTLAERFRDAGYHTAAFTAAFPTQARWGFDQGFAVYHDPLERLPDQLDWRDERPASAVIDDALATLATATGPTLAWVHLFDAHWPYKPPEPFLSGHEGRPYDGEIAYADNELGRLLTWWDERFPNSIVVLTSDHGEAMGEGGEQTHGFLLHDGTIRVPLILRGPGIDPGSVVDTPVSHVDIAPTVLALAGISLHEGMDGKDLRTGGSGQAYSEALTGQFNLGLAPLSAVTESGGRYTEGGYGAWYPASGSKVAVDPDQGAVLSGPRDRLAAMRGGHAEIEAPSAALDAEALAQLQALGYMGGDPTAPAGTIDPRDVIDVIPLTWRVRQALSRGRPDQAKQMVTKLSSRMPGTFGVQLLEAQVTRAEGRIREALEMLAALYIQAPSATLALQLAEGHAAAGAWAEAESWFSEAMTRQPNSADAMAGLVQATRRNGDSAHAQALADRFLEVYPDHARIALVRAEMLHQNGRLDEAHVAAEAALASMPRSAWAQTLSAQLLWELGRPNEAIERLQEALQLDRTHVPVRLLLVQTLLEVGRNAEAVRMVLPALRMLPDRPEVVALAARAQAALKAERAKQ